MLAHQYLTRIRVLLFFAIACFPSIAAAQQQKPTGNSIISGRVVYADTGRPVRRATVMLYSDFKRSGVRVTPANVRGEFRFGEVPAGAYFVVAEAPGVISPISGFSITELGFGGNQETEYTRVTVDGKNAIRCEIKVVRAGTIRGTMTYDDKEPVVNARVLLYRRKGGVVAPFFSNAVMTNDRGMYRLDGLPDGEYFVGLASGETGSAGPGVGRREMASVANAFYPGVRSLAEAKPVQIQSGSEVTDINISVNHDVLREISGVVKWRRNSEPLVEGAMMLRRKDDPKVDINFANLASFMPNRDDDDDALLATLPLLMMVLPTTTEVNDKGEWAFKDLAPGTYVVTAVAQLSEARISEEKSKEKDPSEPRADMEFERRYVTRHVELTVDQEDLKNVKIELSEGGSILGTVVGEDAAPVGFVPILVNQKGVDPFILNLPRMSQPDGTFMLEGVPAGEALIDITLPRRADLYLKSITLGGQDLMREALRMEDGAEVAGIRITLGTGVATLSGHAKLSEGGSPAAGAGVLLVRADSTLWHLQSLRFFTSADANGQFTLSCAPGDYLLFTWHAGNQPLQRVEDFVREQAASARRITLQSKEEKQMELTIAAPDHKKAQKTQEAQRQERD